MNVLFLIDQVTGGIDFFCYEIAQPASYFSLLPLLPILEKTMNDGIYDIRGEIRIAAESEQAARKLVEHQEIAKDMCFWRKNPLGSGGYLYIGVQLFFDVNGNKLTFQRPCS